MSDMTWASDMLRKHVAPAGSAPSIQERIRNAAIALQWKYSRAATLWYADERAAVKPNEIRKLEEVTGIEYGRQELRGVEDLISSADALLLGNDPDFHSAFVAALRAFAGALVGARAARGSDDDGAAR